MSKKQFNLVADPWINVIETKTDSLKTVSLIECFNNAHQYRQLAGDMRAQDLAIMRFLLAILHTVYSRFDMNGEPYEWVNIDSETFHVNTPVDEDDFDVEDLFQTWGNLYKSGKFSKIITQYLDKNQSRFNLFGDQAFYQVTEEEYDSFVPKKKYVATGTGTVAVKQLNRQISESGNTPAIFTPKSDTFKNRLSLSELTRWLITYQNFTGVTDKTKVQTEEKFSNPAGWVYRLNPVFAKGKSLFETLMLNLVLADEEHYQAQKPVWEYKSVTAYVEERKKEIAPDNLAFLYTAWSRILHIKWDENDEPTIFSAGIPMFSNENMWLEPMTVWKKDIKASKGGDDVFKPAVKGTRSLGIAMWRHFGDYINADQANDHHEPGIVSWLNTLKEAECIDPDRLITLTSVALISDGNATSQAPVAEVYDDMSINADVLFDTNENSRWPLRIESVISFTQAIAKDYWRFAADVAQIRGIDSKIFANKMGAQFYDRLNEPFKDWLVSLTNQDNRDDKIIEWKDQLKSLVFSSANELAQNSSPRDKGGIVTEKGPLNIFIAKNRLVYNIHKH